jgi:hypothetical protein
MITIYTCRRGQGRVAEILDEVVTLAADPLLVPLRPIAVLAALDCADRDLAEALIGRWGADVRDDGAADFLLAVWGFVAARLGVPDPGELYDRLLPYADRLITMGMGSAGWGSYHLVLAELAQRLGRREQAIEHARQAAATHRRLGLAYYERRSVELLAALSG